MWSKFVEMGFDDCWGEGFSEMIVRWYEMLLRLGTAWISRRCKDCAFRLS